MNRIDPPGFFDDEAALDALSQNRRLGSYPTLAPYVAALKVGYQQYLGAQGDAYAILPVDLPEQVGDFLIGHYGQPPQALSHITQMREQSAVGTCPMCGSLHSWSLDHVLPKETYPAFAIFGPNLVPACQCNSKRGAVLTGQNPGERILHPYFDDVLGERNLAARFDDLGRAPHISVRLLRDPTDEAFPALSFHLAKVVMRAGIKNYLVKAWAKLVRRPSLIAADLRIKPPTGAALLEILEAERDRLDDARDSKNNWDSIFITGLLDDHVVDWLFERLTDPLRDHDTALRI